METTGIGGASGGANIFATKRTKYAENPFLKLLITQLRAQSPLDPVDNGSMMTQMSQLSSMEQQKELNDNLLNLLQFQGALARMNGLSQGASMIGKQVEFIDGEKGTRKKGVVESVSVNEQGEIMLRIQGKDHPLASVVAILAGRTPKKSGGSSK